MLSVVTSVNAKNKAPDIVVRSDLLPILDIHSPLQGNAEATLLITLPDSSNLKTIFQF